MELPWKNQELEDRVEQLEASLKEKKQEIEKLEQMLEAEEERRSELARKKQDAEEKLNRLEDRLEGLEDTSEEEESSGLEFNDISFQKFKSSIEKLESIDSPERDMVSIYSPGKVSGHSDLSDIRNSLPEEVLTPMLNEEKIAAFYVEELGLFCFRLRPFFPQKIHISEKFDVEGLKDFIEEDKHWALVSRGDSRIFTEKDGEFEEVERINDRVNRQHGKGGFSQGRFERKRDEQVEQHLQKLGEKLEGLENLYILGDKALSKELPGTYLGGFDPNSSPLQNFYRPRSLKKSGLTG
ncbi:MAG: Vms1/Ankzf1 family peptidyl-tRNA hydrolase [Candidatus Nanohaloarchaea archaeon]